MYIGVFGRFQIYKILGIRICNNSASNLSDSKDNDNYQFRCEKQTTASLTECASASKCLIYNRSHQHLIKMCIQWGVSVARDSDFLTGSKVMSMLL